MRGPSASTRTTSRRRCGPSCPAVSTEPMSTGTATKTCRKCGEAKSTSEFHKHANGKGGLHSECKECTKARVRAYYHANRERALARKAEYRRANPARTNTQRKEHQRGTQIEQYQGHGVAQQPGISEARHRTADHRRVAGRTVGDGQHRPGPACGRR